MSLFTSDSSLITRLRLSFPVSLSLFLSPSRPFLLVSRPPVRDLELDRLIFLLSALTDSLKSSLASPLVRGAELLLADLKRLLLGGLLALKTDEPHLRCSKYSASPLEPLERLDTWFLLRPLLLARSGEESGREETTCLSGDLAGLSALIIRVRYQSCQQDLTCYTSRGWAHRWPGPVRGRLH